MCVNIHYNEDPIIIEYKIGLSCQLWFDNFKTKQSIYT